MRTTDIQDDEFQDEIITAVEKQEGGYAVTHDGWTLWVKTQEIEPKPGDILRMYGKGIGYVVRGIAINGHVVRYQTEQEERDAHRARVEADDQAKRDKAISEHGENEAKIAALPSVFQDRIKRFQRVNPDFEWQYQSYELFVCQQAVAFAEAFTGDVEGLKEWSKADWQDQKKRVPAMDEGHSGNTFGIAVRLAWHYLVNPDLVPQEHGAMCPLVGCKDYGCWAAEVSENAA